ncbi:MAG: DNA repair protein RadC [Chlorobia bacterium]|nr:DNA repair protein RadC [Fimbriimonadaceae bacterium]
MAKQVDSAFDRLLDQGVAAGSITDLLSVGFSRSEVDSREAETMARAILRRYDRLVGLQHASYDELKDLTGLDRFEVLRAQALMELGRKFAGANIGDHEEVELPEDVYQRLRHLKDEKREHFQVILLDARNKIQRIAPIHIGTLTMSVVGPREVFREAVRESACSIIVAHNHPSGDPTPSPEDIDVTKKLVEVGQMLDIPLIDHIIIGYDKFTSFAKMGLL